MIAGGNKRAIPLFRYDTAFMGAADIRVRLLKQVFQVRLLSQPDGIELVQVDQSEAVQRHLRFALAAEVDAVGIISPQFRRKQVPALGGFSASLAACQQGNHAVGMRPVHLFPLGYQSEKPAVEMIGLICIAGLNGRGQRTDMVVPVPCRQRIQIVVYRIIDRYQIRINIPFHIPVPETQPFGMRLQTDSVQRFIGNRLKRTVIRIAFVILHLSFQLVTPEIIPPLHKFIQLQSQ